MVKRLFVALIALAWIGLTLVESVQAQTPTTKPATPSTRPLEVINPNLDPGDAKIEATLAAEEPPADQDADQEKGVEEAATTRPRSETFLPAATKAWVSIPDADDLDERFSKTQFGALAKEEDLKPFTEHLKSQAKKWIDQQNVRLNLSIDDLHGVHSGEICFAGVLPQDAAGESIKGQHGLVFLMDVSETQDKAVELQTKINAELVKRGANQSQGSINGVDYTKSVIEKPKVFRKPRYNFQAIVNGWMVVSNNEVVFRDIIGRIANPDKIQPVETLAAQDAFATVMKNTTLGEHKANIRWYVDPFGYLELSQQIKDDEAIAKVARDDIAKKLKNAGLEAFKGVGGSVAVATGEHEILHRTFTIGARNKKPENASFHNLFDFSSPKIPLKAPFWAPDDASSIAIGNWDFDKALVGVGHFYDSSMGQPGDFDRILDDFKNDPGLQLDVRKLISSLDDQVIVVTATEKPVSKDSERVIAGIRVSGDPAFVFDAIKRAHPDATEISLGGQKVIEYDSSVEPDDLVDDPILTFGGDIPQEEIDEEEEKPRFEAFEKRFFTVLTSPAGEKFLLVANNKTFLRKILAQRKNNLENASDVEQVYLTLDKLTDADKVAWRTFGRLDATLEINYELIRQGEMANAQTVLARLLNFMAVKQAEEEALAQGKEVDPKMVRKQELDGSTLPESYSKAIAPYLGPVGSVLEVEPEGWRITGAFLKKKVTEVVQKPDEIERN